MIKLKQDNMKTKFFLLLFAYMASSMIFATDVFDFTTMNLSQSDMSITNGSVSYNSSKGYYEVSNNANDTLSMTINGVPNVVFKYWAETSKKAFKVKSNEYIQLDGATRTLRITNLNINDIVTLRVASKGPSAANSFSGGLTNCTLESGNLTQAEYDYPFVYEDVSFKATASTIEITNTAGGYCLETISIERNQSSGPPTTSGTIIANGACGPNLTWELTSDSILTISGTGEMDNYAWPLNAPWYSIRNLIAHVVIQPGVTSIGNSAFYYCEGLASIIIPNSVISIGSNALIACSRLTSITIPQSVTSIGDHALCFCSGLDSVYIPNGVTNIENYVFYGCSGLTSMTIPNSVTSLGKYAFEGCSGLTSITIPSGVISIDYGAFSGCSGLTSITIPNSVTSIGDWAFSMVANIEYWGSAMGAPWGARTLNGIVDGDLVYQDLSKTNLTACFASTVGNIIIPESVKSIGDDAFYNCSRLTSITIPNGVTSIGEFAFNGCSGLTSFTIPDSVIYIGSSAFSGCENLATIICKSSIPAQLGYFDDGVSWFDPFSNIITPFVIYVPCGSAEAYRTADVWQLYASQIQIPLSATIQTAPLVEGTGQVNIPQTICDTLLEAIPAYGYHFVQWTDSVVDNPRLIDPTTEATYIAQFELEKSGRCGDDLLLRWAYDSESQTLTISGNGTFNSNIQYGVEAPLEMTSLIVEDSVQSIGANAFAGIPTLTSVTLGQDVSRIRENAFYDCENLTVIRNYRPTPATVYSNTFDGVDKFTCTLYVPEGSVAMYSAATGWRDFYSIVGFNPTGHENLSEDASAIRKVFIDGHLYISLPDGTRYDATGKKVE